jgi:hypothetical protein
VNKKGEIMSRKLVSVQISSELFLELASYLQDFGDEGARRFGNLRRMAQSLRNALALVEKAACRRQGKLERRTDILPDD